MTTTIPAATLYFRHIFHRNFGTKYGEGYKSSRTRAIAVTVPTKG